MAPQPLPKSQGNQEIRSVSHACTGFVEASGQNRQIFTALKWVCMVSYPSVLTFVLGAQKNRLNETVLLSTHNICFD